MSDPSPNGNGRSIMGITVPIAVVVTLVVGAVSASLVWFEMRESVRDNARDISDIQRRLDRLEARTTPAYP